MKSTHSSYEHSTTTHMYAAPTLHCYLFKKSYNPLSRNHFKPHISELSI